ncbi:MAG: TolC family protein [Novosphingobium sp.]
MTATPKHQPGIRFTLIMIVVATITPMPQSVNAMTVNEAVAAALARHPTLSAAGSEVKAAHSEVKAAKSGYLPSISASGGPQGASPDEWAYEVTVAQPVYDWGATTDKVDSARATEQQRRIEWTIARDQSASDVIEIYLDVMQGQMQHEANLSQIEALENLSRMTSIRADGGYADRSEPDRTRLELARARQRLASDMGQAANACAQFETLVGAPPDGLVQPRPASMMQRIKGMYLEALIDEAPLYRKALKETHYALARFSEARSSAMPHVNLEATALSREINGRMANDAVIALRLRMTPMQGLASFDRIDAARERVEAAHWKEAATRRDIARALQDLITNATALDQQEQALLQQVSDAENLSSVYFEQFEVGRRDIIDLVTIQRELFDARRSLIEVTLQLVRIQYRIASQIGKLSDLVALPSDPL